MEINKELIDGWLEMDFDRAAAEIEEFGEYDDEFQNQLVAAVCDRIHEVM